MSPHAMFPLSSRSKEPHQGSGAAPGGGSSGPTLPKVFFNAPAAITPSVSTPSPKSRRRRNLGPHTRPQPSLYGLVCMVHPTSCGGPPGPSMPNLPRKPTPGTSGKPQARRPAWHLQVQLRGPPACLRARELTHELPRGAPGIGTSLPRDPGRQVRVPGLAVQ